MSCLHRRVTVIKQAVASPASLYYLSTGYRLGSRIAVFVEAILRSPSEVPHRLLPGLSVIQSELCAFTARFVLYLNVLMIPYFVLHLLGLYCSKNNEIQTIALQWRISFKISAFNRHSAL